MCPIIYMGVFILWTGFSACLYIYQPMTQICVMSSHKHIIIYMRGLILRINTLYRLFCFFKLLPMVGKGLFGRAWATLDDVYWKACLSVAWLGMSKSWAWYECKVNWVEVQGWSGEERVKFWLATPYIYPYAQVRFTTTLIFVHAQWHVTTYKRRWQVLLASLTA